MQVIEDLLELIRSPIERFPRDHDGLTFLGGRDVAKAHVAADVCDS